MDAQPTTIDLKPLAAEVSALHGIRIDSDDPMMAVMTLNRLVFEAAVAQVLERVQASVRDFEVAAEKVQVRAGGALAQEVRDSGVVMRQEVAKLMEDLRPVGRRGQIGKYDTGGSPGEGKWFFIALAFACALFGFGVWVGQTIP